MVSVLRWLPPVGWAALIFVGSSLSSPGGSAPGWVSYVAHAVEFGVLGLLVALALGEAGTAGAGRRGVVIAWAIAAGYGATDELHQAFVPGRDASVVDWLVDVAGAGAGAAAAVPLRCRFTRWGAFR